MRFALLAAALFLLAGCGGDDEPATSTAPADGETMSEPTTTTTVEEKTGQGDEFTIERVGPGQSTAAIGKDPEGALEIFFTSGDPDLVCGELATEALLSSAYGDEKGCRQAQVPAAVPDAIEIEGLELSGDEATATVIPDGGPNDGIETTVTLVDDDGWRVDALEADIPAGP